MINSMQRVRIENDPDLNLQSFNGHGIFTIDELNELFPVVKPYFSALHLNIRKLVQRPIKSLYLKPGVKLMIPRSILTSPNLNEANCRTFIQYIGLREVSNQCHFSLEIFKLSELQRKSAWLRLT